MKSSEGEEYLAGEGVKKSIEDLIESGHDLKVRDIILYNDVINISDISYSQGYDNGIDFERNKEDYDTYIISLFKKVSDYGYPKQILGKTRSKICVCFCPGSNCKEVDRYVHAYYDHSVKQWIPCLGIDIVGCINPSHYLELPEPHKMKKEYDVTGQSKSTNFFKEIPDGVYLGKFGGHVGMIEYLGKVYNFTFLKGIPQINIPKTITVISGYGWTLLKDGPITPNFIGGYNN